jgi:hypothetical protein
MPAAAIAAGRRCASSSAEGQTTVWPGARETEMSEDATRVAAQAVLDYQARDYDSLLRAMRAEIPHKLPGWTDFESEADFGNVLLQLFAHMGDILSYYQDRVATESFLGTAQTRRSIIHHLRLIGYRLATAAPASTKLSLHLPAARTEPVVIRRGDAFATRSRRDAPSVRFEYNAEQPLEIPCDTLAAADGTKIFKGVPVEEGQLIKNELLGTSDGTPHQRFALAHPRLIIRSLGQGQAINRDVILTTNLGGTDTAWELRDSLAFSRAQQRDFTLDIDEHDQATVQFGDGLFGAIPPAEAEVRATYRVGGGQHGNVPAGSIDTIVDAPQLSLLAAKVHNDQAAVGGAERQGIQDAVRQAPHVFRTLERAVTASDYAALAREFRGVGKVRAVATNWKTVTLYVAPQGGGRVSDVLEFNLRAYFEDKRPVTTTIEIDDVDYVDIYVTANVHVLRHYDPGRVIDKVIQAAGGLLAFEQVDFAQPVYLSAFYQRIEHVDGVAAVNITEFRPRRRTVTTLQEDDYVPVGREPDTGEPLLVARTGKIPLEDHELPRGAYKGSIRVFPEMERKGRA